MGGVSVLRGGYSKKVMLPVELSPVSMATVDDDAVDAEINGVEDVACVGDGDEDEETEVVVAMETTSWVSGGDVDGGTGGRGTVMTTSGAAMSP